jgi:oxalate decarboxylase
MFRSDRYADVSLNQWLTSTPRALVEAHLKISGDVVARLRATKVPVIAR